MSKETVAICICTCKRPGGLTRLLKSLALQKGETLEKMTVRVVVVDNDPQASGAESCRKKKINFPFTIEYAVEPHPGISHARNRCIVEAAGADYYAFIDDDEIAEEDWLENLLRTCRERSAQAVTGPVLARLEIELPEYLKTCYQRERHPEGTEIDMFRTGNLLVTAGSLAGYAPPFSLAFGRSGGEDSLLAMQFRAEGKKIVWADRAVVHEFTPPERCREDYLLRRAMLSQGAYTRACLHLNPGLCQRISRLLRGLLRLGMGVGMFAAGLITGQEARFRGRMHCRRALGSLGGVFDITLQRKEQV